MKRCYLILFFLGFVIPMCAQTLGPVKTGPLAQQQRLHYREVSGIVKDSTSEPVVGATITLTSKKDTLKITTDEDGVFIFKNVSEPVFIITIQAVGYSLSNRKYLNNDDSKRIVLDPIILSVQSFMLKEVKVNGVPSIVYKSDTVEFRANDYKVRENATVDELLKKMEGMEVGTDGTLMYQGQQVTKARLNGKDYAGGDVAQAIKNLPANIVDKAQVVNDYGDQAGRTGIKDGIPTSVLNLTTKAEKSVGNIARLTVGAGTDKRYEEKLFAQRLNANEQIGLIGNISNTINGVANNSASSVPSNSSNPIVSGGSLSANGGTTTSGNSSVYYRNQWGKYIQINANYSLNFNNINALNQSEGKTFSSLGATSFSRTGTSKINNKRHTASVEIEYTPDSSNFLRITPAFTYSGLNSASNNQYTQSGFQNQYSNGITSNKNSTPSIGAIVLYQYTFRKSPGKNISFQSNLTYANQDQHTEQNTEIQYRDSLQHLIKDSTVHREIWRGNISKNYRSSLTYTQPLSRSVQLDINTQLNYRGYKNNATTSNINQFGTRLGIDSLSNNYKYSFTESRITANFKINKSKLNLSIGATAIPTKLIGTNISKGVSTDRTDFFIIPVFRAQYQVSRSQQLTLNYSGVASEPSFTQIQPIPDFSDPQSPVYGNPNLGPSFTHTITGGYNNYISNPKINISAAVTANFYQNQIETNIIQVSQPALNSYVNEMHFVNLNGSKLFTATYNFSKQLDDRNYNLALNGLFAYGHEVGMSNNLSNHLTTWRLNERLGPKMTPNESIEINPFLSYSIVRTFNSLPSYNSFAPSSSDIRTTAVNLEGKFYLLNNKTLTIEYSLSKNYVKGISANISKNPLVANFYLEKEFFQRKNGILRLSVFDLFNQNNFVNHQVSTFGYIDTRTNALSRFVIFSFILNLQKWTRITTKDGKAPKRRGDGSFINY